MRRGSEGRAWPPSAPLGDMGRAISTSSPCIIDPPAPPSVVSSSSSLSEKKLPKIYIQDVEGETLPPGSPGWSLDSEVWLRGQGLEPGSVLSDPTSTRRSLPLEAEHYRPPPDQAKEPTDCPYSQPVGVQLEPGQGPDQSQRAWRSSSHSSVFSPSSDTALSSSDWPPSGSSRRSGWNSSNEDLQARTGMAAVCVLFYIY